MSQVGCARACALTLRRRRQANHAGRLLFKFQNKYPPLAGGVRPRLRLLRDGPDGADPVPVRQGDAGPGPRALRALVPSPTF